MVPSAWPSESIQSTSVWSSSRPFAVFNNTAVFTLPTNHEPYPPVFGNDSGNNNRKQPCLSRTPPISLSPLQKKTIHERRERGKTTRQKQQTQQCLQPLGFAKKRYGEREKEVRTEIATKPNETDQRPTKDTPQKKRRKKTSIGVMEKKKRRNLSDGRTFEGSTNQRHTTHKEMYRFLSTKKKTATRINDYQAIPNEKTENAL